MSERLPHRCAPCPDKTCHLGEDCRPGEHPHLGEDRCVYDIQTRPGLGDAE